MRKKDGKYNHKLSPNSPTLYEVVSTKTWVYKQRVTHTFKKLLRNFDKLRLLKMWKFLIRTVLCLVTLYSASVNGQRFREPCFQPDQPCDAIANLYCSTTGFCECQFPWMVFHQAKRLCQVSAGHECDTGSNLMCTENSSCVNIEREMSKCACDDGYEECQMNEADEDLNGGGGAAVTTAEDPSRAKVCCVKNSSEESSES